jgi:hypothetical protein
MARKPPQRRRATRAEIEQHGTNPRLVWKDPVSAAQRLSYICGVSFGGDAAKMAFVLGVYHRYLADILRGHSRLTLRFAAHVVRKLGVRAEWLVCGSGDVFAAGSAPDTQLLAWPTVQSVYQTADSLFDVGSGIPAALSFPAALSAAALSPAAAEAVRAAGQKIFEANAAQLPVLVYLSPTAVSPAAADSWETFFAKKYAATLLLPLTTVAQDFLRAAPSAPPSTISAALRAATAGASFGETLCAVAPAGSLLRRVYAKNATVLVTATIGDIPEHSAPNPHPLETGAAIGAAAFVDWLALQDRMRGFFSGTGGVFIAGDDIARVVAILHAQHAQADSPTAFTLVAFTEPAASDRQIIEHLGGTLFVIPISAADAIAQVLVACDSAYTGF